MPRQDGTFASCGATQHVSSVWRFTRVVSSLHPAMRMPSSRSGMRIRAKKSRVRGHKSPVYGVAFSSNGQLLATGGSNGNLKIWDMSTNRVIQSLTGRSGAVLDSCFSPDDRYLAYGGGDGTVRVWDLEAGMERLIFRGHAAPVESVKFSPDGQRLVSSSPSEAVVKVWDFTRHPEYTTFARVRGKENEQVKVRDLTARADAALLARTGPDIEALAFHADRKHILSVAVGGNLQTWDAATGMLKEQRSLAMCDELVSPAVIASFSNDAKHLAARRARMVSSSKYGIRALVRRLSPAGGILCRLRAFVSVPMVKSLSRVDATLRGPIGNTRSRFGMRRRVHSLPPGPATDCCSALRSVRTAVGWR